MISTAVVFALLSLGFSGLNDVLFKRYNRHDRSRGMLIFGIGVVWTLLQSGEILVTGVGLEFNRPTWIFGVAAGVCVAAANIGLLEALRHLDVSLGSTIYRLNTIGVVILSLLFLGESMSLVKLAGIALGIFAVLLLYQRSSDAISRGAVHTGLIVIVVAAMLRACFGVISKAGLTAGADPGALILLSGICWIISGFGYALLVEKRHKITSKKILYAVLSGTLVYIIVRCLIMALTLGEASIVVPIANMSFLVALLVAMMLKMEALTRQKVVAMILAVCAIVLLTRA